MDEVLFRRLHNLWHSNLLYASGQGARRPSDSQGEGQSPTRHRMIAVLKTLAMLA
jgi:hypothetical protein